MEVSHRQKLRGLFVEPLGFGQRLALEDSGGYGRSYKSGRSKPQVSHCLSDRPALGCGRPKRPASLCAAETDSAMRSLVALPVTTKDIGQFGAPASLSCHQPWTGKQHDSARSKAGVA